MIKLNSINSVFFDADNTIVDHKECEKLALVYLFKNIKIDYKEEYQNIFRPLDRQLWDNATKGISNIKSEEIPTYRFKKFFEIIHINYDNYSKANFLFSEGLANSVALLENSEEIMKYLYDKGYHLYIVTNGLVKLQKPRILNSSISKFLSDIIVSEEVGKPKPNPKIFQVLMDRHHIKASEAIMIGDSLSQDILGAKNCNIKNIWYNPEGIDNTTGIIPDYEINNLLELKTYL